MSGIIKNVRNTIAENLGGPTQKLATGRFSIEQVPDQSQKVAVVTGGTEGIGYAVAHTLLLRNIAHVHLLSPSKEVAEQAQNDIKSDLGHETAKRVTWHQLDLSDWMATQKIGEDIAKQSDRLDILVNNGGRGIMTYATADSSGFDRHMTLNHFGHVVLTTALLPLLKKTAETNTVRIVNQGSNAHQQAPSDTKFASEDELRQDLGPQALYGRSKLANILYSRYLGAHLTPSYPRLLVNATHPGIVETAMSQRDIHEPYPIAGYAMSGLLKPLKKNQWDGALSTLYAATATEHSGTYVCPPAVEEPGSELAQDKGLGEQLMKLTREILSKKLNMDQFNDC